MKQFEILDGKAVVLELPVGAHGIHLSKDVVLYRLAFWVDAYMERKSHPLNAWLPPGNWQILDRLSELTEEKAAGLVELPQYGHYFNYAYENPAHKWLRTARESLESAIRSQGYYLDVNPHRDPGLIPSAELQAYREAQSRVLSRKRCLILRRMEE